MKKILFLTVVLLFSAALFAQKQTTDIKSSQLPQETQNYIKNNLPGCQITKATKVIEAGKVSYDVVVDVKGKKNLFVFDGIGAFVKRGDPILQADPNKLPATTGGEQKIVPAEQQKTVQQTGEKDVKTVQNKKVAQPVSPAGPNPNQQKASQTTATQPQGTAAPSKVPATTRKIAKPESQGTQPANQPKSTQQTTPQGVKASTDKKVAQPATSGGVKPASSGAVQQTGSKNVQQTGTQDKKVAQPTGSGDMTKPK
ncbi:MAG: hypothetical protein WCO93_02355 [bacterium]